MLTLVKSRTFFFFGRPQLLLLYHHRPGPLSYYRLPLIFVPRRTLYTYTIYIITLLYVYMLHEESRGFLHFGISASSSSGPGLINDVNSKDGGCKSLGLSSAHRPDIPPNHHLHRIG